MADDLSERPPAPAAPRPVPHAPAPSASPSASTQSSASIITVRETDVNSLRDAVNAASAGARGSWLAFLAFTAYLFIAIAGVTHRDLLLNAPVNLPLFQVAVPLDQFFLMAPIVFIGIHFGVLVQHVLLTQKAAQLDALLTAREAGGHERGGDPSARDPARLTLDSYFIPQTMVGPARKTLLAFFLDTLIWLSLVIVPLILIFAFQVTFLPFHDAAITWTHRVVLFAELIVVVLLGAYLYAPELRLGSVIKNVLRRRPLRFVFTLLMSIICVLFSCLVATIPGEPLDRFARTLNPTVAPWFGVEPGTTAASETDTFHLTTMLFEGSIDPITGTASSPFLRNLVVTDADLVPESDRAVNRPHPDRTLSLRGRDLRHATLDRTDLHGADLTGANLERASLQGTRLSDAVLTAANLRGAWFWRPGQEDADFLAADLSGASLRRAQMESTNLHGVRARLADFSGAQLIGATFLNADLQGADFQSANLTAVGFAGADLAGARLKGATLDAARFTQARLAGADVSLVAFYGVDLSGADLTAVDLRGGPVWATAAPNAAPGFDMAFRRVVPPPDDRKAVWTALLDGTWTPDGGAKLRSDLSPLLDAAALNAWGESRDDQGWTPAPVVTGTGGAVDPAVVTRLLVELACDDDTERAALASGIARRASEIFLFTPQFNGDPMALHAALTGPRCGAVAARLSSETRAALRRAARLAAKLRAPQAGAVGPTVPGLLPDDGDERIRATTSPPAEAPEPAAPAETPE